MSTRTVRFLLIGAAVVAAAAILWLDIVTGLWQEYVVIAGLAAGLVTFLLTALVIDRVIARSTHESWAPVTRIALGDLRRRLADADTPRREQRERPAARRLPDPSGSPDALDRLIDAATAEQEVLTDALARWASFLAASADVTEIMDAVAEIAHRLDRVEETAWALRDTRCPTGPPSADDAATSARSRELLAEIDAFHRTGDTLLARIDAVLRQLAKEHG